MSFVKHGFYQVFLMIPILLGTGSIFGMAKEEPKKAIENLSQLIEQRYLLDHITRLVENEKVEFDDTSLNCALFYKRADVVPLIIKHQSQLRSSAENPFLRQHVDTNSILLREKRGKNIFSAIDKVKSENRESKGIMSGIKNLVSKTTNEIFFTLGLVTPNALCGLIDKEKKDCDLRLVEFLLKKGAKPNDPQFQLFTPMYYAIKHKNKPVVELLCNYGAKPPSIVDLCHAIDRESEDCDVSIVEFLLQKGAKPDDSEFKFLTPMYDAIKHKNKPVIELLCKYGAKPPSIVDLCHAIDRESEDCDVSIVEFLLQNGAKPDDSEFKFLTPIV